MTIVPSRDISSTSSYMFLYDFIVKMDKYAKKIDEGCAEIDASHFKDAITQLSIDHDPKIQQLANEWKGRCRLSCEQYIRVPIHRTSTLELIMIIWNPLSTTPVHSHPEYGCLFHVLEGTIHTQEYTDGDMSSIYRINGERIMTKSSVDYTRGQHGIHRVFNPYTTTAVSIHLYIHRRPIYRDRRSSEPNVGRMINIP